VKLVKQHTRNYAKRQLTWFRKESRREENFLEDGESPEETQRKIMERIQCDH